MRRLLAVVVMCGAVAAVFAAPAGLVAGKVTFVDIQPKANQKLTDNLGTGAKGNDLAALPTGERTFGGVTFKVGEGLIQLGSKVLDKMPAKVEGIAVGRPVSRLHILHATCFGGGPNRPGDPWFVKDNTPIGEYRINFDDDSALIIPVVYGKDVRDWFYVEGEPKPSRGTVAWTGVNARSKQVGAEGIRLYLTSWVNPWPHKKVMTIDYSARKDDTVAAPFCVAISVEEKK
jgi:hypothetical protein